MYAICHYNKEFNREEYLYKTSDGRHIFHKEPNIWFANEKKKKNYIEHNELKKSNELYIKEENAMIHCIFNEPELSDEQKEMVEELKDKIMKASLDAYIPMEFLPKAVKSPVESIKFPTLVKNQIKCIDKSAIPQEVVEAPDLAKYNKDKLKGLCKPCFIESEEDRLKMQEVERRIDAMADERIANMLRLILGISKDMTQEEKERIIDDYLSLITYRGDKDGNGSNS